MKKTLVIIGAIAVFSCTSKQDDLRKRKDQVQKEIETYNDSTRYYQDRQKEIDHMVSGKDTTYFKYADSADQYLRKTKDALSRMDSIDVAIKAGK